MNRLTKFDKFSALTGEFMQRGVRTNFFKSREQIERAISDGSVYYELCETSLLLIFSGKVDKLYFMLLSGGGFPNSTWSVARSANMHTRPVRRRMSLMNS